MIRALGLSALIALSACAAAPAAAPSPSVAAAEVAASAPPTVNGVYVYEGCEGEGGCQNRFWRSTVPTPIYAAQDPQSEVLATLSPDEWIVTEAYATRLRPQRGVVQATTGPFTRGEVIYSLWYEGEGFLAIWHEGGVAVLDPESPVEVTWDTPPPLPAEIEATLGLWVHAKREKDGVEGWIHAARYPFECVGQLAGDGGCRG